MANLRFSGLNVPIIGNPNDVYPAPIVDEASTTVTYIGYGNLGANRAKAEWMIVRITKTSATTPNGVVLTEYANGSMKFDQVWNDRATLSYSR